MSPPTSHSAAQIRRLFTQKEVACARYVRGVAQSLGLTESELRVLLCVSRERELSPGLLSLRTGISAPVTGAITARLVDADLVERRPHRRDGRSTVLRLTRRGAGVLERTFAHLADSLDMVFDELSEHEQEIVGRFVARIADASAEAAHAAAPHAAPAPTAIPAVPAARGR